MRLLRLACATVVVVATACGGDGGGTPPPPPVSSVVVMPSGAQSIQACGTVSLSAQARDAQNQPISGAQITWSTSDQSKVSLSTTSGGQTTARGDGVGSSTIRASAGGVTSNPGVTVTVTPGGASANASVGTTATTFTPACVNITAGSTVTWSFSVRHNVTFNTSAEPPGGDIPDQDSGTASRTFPNAGTYPYTCTLHNGMNGIVIVQ